MTQDVPPEGVRGGFLQRWSKRKLEEKSPETPPTGELPAVPPVEEEPFDISTLPTLEEMTGDSDLSVFLQKGVPQALKNAAMRRVWALDPQISAISGPLDYAWDFNDPNGVPGFGPLAADFDPSAMLKRIMGEQDPEPVADDMQNTIAAEERMEGHEIAGPSSTSPEYDLDPSSALRDGQSFQSHSVPNDEIVSELNNKNQQFADEDVVETELSSQKFDIALPRKRHGGAVPL